MIDPYFKSSDCTVPQMLSRASLYDKNLFPLPMNFNPGFTHSTPHCVYKTHWNIYSSSDRDRLIFKYNCKPYNRSKRPRRTTPCLFSSIPDSNSQTNTFHSSQQQHSSLRLMSSLSHLDQHGNAQMVDVSSKSQQQRFAIAYASVYLSSVAAKVVHNRNGDVSKGNILSIAQLAGINAAKYTANLIPLCHNVPLDGVDVRVVMDNSTPNTPIIAVFARARATWRTGVEMEAMTAASISALTVYDMLKAVDKGLSIGDIRLLLKSGGKSGLYVNGIGNSFQSDKSINMAVFPNHFPQEWLEKI
eukprot:gene4657-8603_t